MQRSTSSKSFKDARLWRFIVLGIVAIYVITSLIFCGKVLLEPPKLNSEISITKDQLYEGLKDFARNDDTITSLTNDPWIEVKLEKEVQINGIIISVSNLSKEKTNAQVYYASSGQNFEGGKYIDFILKNGDNLVKFPNGSSIKSLRLDLSDIKDVSVNVHNVKVKLNNNLLLWMAFICIAILYSGIIIWAYFYNGEKKKII